MSKSEGARAPNDRHPNNNPATFRRPRRCFATSRVLAQRQRASGPTRASTGRAIVVRDHRPAARLEHEPRRCAKGVRAECCHACTASNPQPRHLRRASLTTMLRTESNTASTGHRSLPRVRRSADASLVAGKDARQYGGSERGEDYSRAIEDGACLGSFRSVSEPLSADVPANMLTRSL